MESSSPKLIGDVFVTFSATSLTLSTSKLEFGLVNIFSVEYHTYGRIVLQSYRQADVVGRSIQQTNWLRINNGPFSICQLWTTFCVMNIGLRLRCEVCVNKGTREFQLV